MSYFDKLRDLRHQASILMGNGREAVFDLMAAVLVSRSVDSFGELSWSPVLRGQWSSLSAALQDSEPPRLQLMSLDIEQRPQNNRIVLAGDHTAWPRLQAQTLRARTYEQQANPMSGAKPVTVGQGDSTLAWLPESQGRWALPLVHERLSSAESPIGKAVPQLRPVAQKRTRRLRSRRPNWGHCAYGCGRTAI